MSDFLQKLLNKAKSKADDLQKAPKRVPGKKTKKPDTPSVSDTPTISDTGDVSDTHIISDTLRVSDTANQSPLSVLNTFANIQSQISKNLPPMSPSALKLYLYLVNNSSDGIIDYNQRDVMQTVGFVSHTTIVKSLSSLENLGLISWMFRSQKRGKKSKIKVVLPDSLQIIKPSI